MSVSKSRSKTLGKRLGIYAVYWSDAASYTGAVAEETEVGLCRHVTVGMWDKRYLYNSLTKKHFIRLINNEGGNDQDWIEVQRESIDVKVKVGEIVI